MATPVTIDPRSIEQFKVAQKEAFKEALLEFFGDGIIGEPTITLQEIAKIEGKALGTVYNNWEKWGFVRVGKTKPVTVTQRSYAAWKERKRK